MARKAAKLLDQMRQSTSNWKRRDLVTLFEGYGFLITHGGDHDIVKHPDHPMLRFTLPRHNQLATGYIRSAVKLVDQMLRENKINETDQEDETGGHDESETQS